MALIMVGDTVARHWLQYLGYLRILCSGSVELDSVLTLAGTKIERIFLARHCWSGVGRGPMVYAYRHRDPTSKVKRPLLNFPASLFEKITRSLVWLVDHF